MRNLAAALIAAIVLLAVQAPSRAGEPFDGLWATTKNDCRHTDEADSRTLIDLDNVIKGKPAPLVDQNEKSLPGRPQDAVWRWTDPLHHLLRVLGRLQPRGNGRKVTIKLAPGPDGTLKIDGNAYLLCKRLSELPNSKQ
jgi:hypothetical protein